MGKDKKQPKLRVKTSRYFTKTCGGCKYEYPNWFTHCPKCGLAWDEIEKEQAISGAIDDLVQKKNIKIVVKITEEDIEGLDYVQLIFSADQGKSWYQMKMDVKMDYFIAEIAEVPIGSVIIYYIEVYLENGEKVIENNSGNYFYYRVGDPITQVEEEPSKAESEVIKENVLQTTTTPQDYSQPQQDSLSQSPNPDNITIFGVPQTQVDPDLKVCPHCNSKIKKMWSVCPICGKQL